MYSVAGIYIGQLLTSAVFLNFVFTFHQSKTPALFGFSFQTKRVHGFRTGMCALWALVTFGLMPLQAALFLVTQFPISINMKEYTLVIACCMHGKAGYTLFACVQFTKLVAICISFHHCCF